MTDEERKLALYCLKASSDYHSEVCEECIKYPNCDHTGQDDVTETIIQALEQEHCEDCISRANALRVAKNEYLRGWHNALCKALSEKYSIHCEEGNFSVIQEETITGLGLSMDCAVGKDVESYMSALPSVTPQPTRWIPVSERLPDIDEEVLVDDGMDRYIAWYVNDGIDEGWHSFDESYSLNVPILAWMPLPEPYKAERSDKE